MAEVTVAVARAGDKLYTYRAQDRVRPGSVLRVPFRKEVRLGVVVEEGGAAQGLALRPALEHLGVLPEDMLALLRFLHDELLNDWGSAVHALLPSDVRPAQEPWFALGEERPAAVRGERQRAVLTALAAGPRPISELALPLAELRRLAARGWLKEVTEPPSPVLAGELPLTAEQLAAARRAVQPGVHLLLGATGSGKTEVYLEAVRQVLAAGYGAIVAVPEIALTAQMVSVFRERFGNLLALQHSRLSEGERAATFARLLSGRARVVLGARSAVLAPVQALRLVVLDEEHEASYQQDDLPRYHARQLARVRAQVRGGSVLLGSATPDVVTLHAARSGEVGTLHLTRRFGAGAAGVEIVDVRHLGQRLLSPRLTEALHTVRRAGRQAILFLNRRGYGRSLVCADCGTGFPCPHCSVALVYHAAERALRCHYCNHRRPAPRLCPRCKGVALRSVGFGTERLEEELARALPDLRILRLDQDAVRHKGSHERILAAFARGEADVLVGTQMVAKGLHFPKVALSAVVLADVTLRFPDYRAAERTFQLVTQVAGRTGRGPETGRVLVQTYSPDHYALRHGANQDVDGFYREELALRREAVYPPFCHLLLFGFTGQDDLAVQEAAQARAEALKAAGREPLGPSPALVHKVRDQYRWQVLVKVASWEQMVDLAKSQSSRPRRSVREAVLLDPMSIL